MKNRLWLISIVLFLVLFAVGFYFFLPALNFQSDSFYLFIVMIFAISLAPLFLSAATVTQRYNQKILTFASTPLLKVFGVCGILVAVYLAGALIFSPAFSSSRYAERITVTDGSFAEDIAEVDLDNLPLLDKDSTQRVGDRVMGQLPELISQFEVSDQYTQISYQGRLVRVTPLEYAGLFKWLGNRAEGSPGYILVDSTTGEASLVKLEHGMKYLTSAYFNENLHRLIRFQYPTEMLATSVFEIDDDGNPFFITPVVSMKWVGILPDIKGAIVTDPISGDSTYYNISDVPLWVDHVYPSSLVLEQINDWGTYQNGWLNSFIGQKNVRQSTEGYTYLSDETDIFIYTGITSAAADESNIGFILTNLRTKETKFYAVPGAEEFSAMSSAEGAVQEKGYTSTFPLLINLNGRPTYLSSLKDSAGLVKSYAFVDVQDYQKVKVTDSTSGLEVAAASYLSMIGNEVISVDESEEFAGVIDSIESVVIDGNTYFYITLVNEPTIFKAPINTDDRLPFLSENIHISFTHSNGVILKINAIQAPLIEPTTPTESGE
ncbi:MAG: CvpA family protein [Anaerorhabdus sp.]